MPYIPIAQRKQGKVLSGGYIPIADRIKEKAVGQPSVTCPPGYKADYVTNACVPIKEEVRPPIVPEKVEKPEAPIEEKKGLFEVFKKPIEKIKEYFKPTEEVRIRDVIREAGLIAKEILTPPEDPEEALKLGLIPIVDPETGKTKFAFGVETGTIRNIQKELATKAARIISQEAVKFGKKVTSKFSKELFNKFGEELSLRIIKTFPEKEFKNIVKQSSIDVAALLKTKRIIPEKIVREAIVKPKVTLKQVIKPPKEEALRKLGEKLKVEAKAAKVGKVVGREEVLAKQVAIKEEKEFLASIKTGILGIFEREKNKIRQSIGFQRKTKNLSGTTMARLKESAGIKEWKNATTDQLNKVLEDSKKLRAGDKFLTEKQLVGLGEYTKTFDNPRLVTQREIMERFRETEDILEGFITKRISGFAFPTVDVKEGHKVITRIVDKADYELRLAHKKIKNVNTEFDVLIRQAEKGQDKLKVGKNIFAKMSGVDVKLTEQESKTVDYLKKYFEQARKDLKLEKYRQNYITNIDKTFLEKLRANKWDLIETIKKYRTKEGDIPIDIMLALDDIVGSEKFFRFALERKGVIDPTTNIRRILQQYSSIFENKKALDKILPEGQASMQLLLQPKSAVWMKKYLQNLKGRGLDYSFRTGKMGWVAKGADKIIDFGYIRLLGLNYMSAIKNVVGGEVNSLVFQTFDKYLTGKKRFILNPKKAHKFISDAGLLDGSYVDIIRQNIIGKGKRAVNLTLYGGMQVAEYEIRGSLFLGELTKQEFKTGIISPQRFRGILDKIAITQGIYTKVDSPLFVQTVLGRSVMQFGRWKITNLNLARRISRAAKKEWAKGEYLGKNTRSLLKMFTIYGIGTYLSYEAGKAGWERGKKIAEAGTELVDLFLNIPEETMRAIQENPMFQTLDATAYTIQELMSYIGVVDEPRKIKFRSGIEDIWLSPVERPKELLGIEKEKPTKETDWDKIFAPKKEVTDWDKVFK